MNALEAYAWMNAIWKLLINGLADLAVEDIKYQLEHNIITPKDAKSFSIFLTYKIEERISKLEERNPTNGGKAAILRLDRAKDSIIMIRNQIILD